MRNKKGFTLVEIMIVVVIIGLLAAMAIPAFNKVRQTSQEKTIMNNLRQISNAADQYFIETGLETVDLDTLVSQGWLRAAPEKVADETYLDTITATTTAVTATGAPATIGDGGTVTYQRMAGD